MTQSSIYGRQIILALLCVSCIHGTQPATHAGAMKAYARAKRLWQGCEKFGFWATSTSTTLVGVDVCCSGIVSLAINAEEIYLPAAMSIIHLGMSRRFAFLEIPRLGPIFCKSRGLEKTKGFLFLEFFSIKNFRPNCIRLGFSKPSGLWRTTYCLLCPVGGNEVGENKIKFFKKVLKALEN